MAVPCMRAAVVCSVSYTFYEDLEFLPILSSVRQNVIAPDYTIQVYLQLIGIAFILLNSKAENVQFSVIGEQNKFSVEQFACVKIIVPTK